MTLITPTELSAWRARLSGQPRTDASTAHGEVPEWFSSSVLRMNGIAGMHQLSNLGAMDAEEPETFEAALLRAPVGDLMLFSTLESPHTITFDRKLRDAVDIVIIGRTGMGGKRLRGPHGIDMMSVGRLGFMSSLAPSSVEHVGLTETTGVVVPTALIAAHLNELDTGVGLLPDTALTRMVGTAVSRLLVDWLDTADHTAHETVTAEAAVLGLVRSLLRQLADADMPHDRAADMRAAALQVIERLHIDAQFGIDELADELHISRRQLYRYFVDAPESVSEALLRRRLLTAQELLLHTPPRGIESIAFAAGFTDAASLRAQFHRHLGTSPSEYRRVAVSKRQLAQAMLLTHEQAPDPGV